MAEMDLSGNGEASQPNVSGQPNRESQLTDLDRIRDVFEQIAECLDTEDIANIKEILSQIIELCKSRDERTDEQTEDEIDKIYSRFLAMLEFRPGISVHLIKQAVKSFMMIEKDVDGLGKEVSEMILALILTEYPSLAIDMQLSDELLKVYFRLLKEGYEEIQHIRLMVVGMYGVGKTTLVNRLLKKSIKDVKSTVGIDMLLNSCEVNDERDWEKVNLDEKENLFKQRLQEIFAKYRKADSSPIERPSSSESPIDPQRPQDFEAPSSHEDPDQVKFNKKVSNFDRDQPTGKKVTETLKEVDKPVHLERRPTVSIWDFAGQSVYYSTHHFFLNARSIYLVVLDLSKDLHEIVKEDMLMEEQQNLILGSKPESTCLDTFKFWMKSIYIYSKQKNRKEYKEYKPKIILVGTFKDKISAEKLKGKSYERYKEEYFDKALECFKNTDVMTLVHNKKFLINNTDSSEDDFLTMKKEIYNISTGMESIWNEKIPAHFIPLEREVFHSKLKDKKIMKFEDLQAVGENIEYTHTEEEITLFLKFQHAFGNVLYYDIENFNKMIILDPQWIIDAFKLFVTHKEDKEATLGTSWSDLKELGKLSSQLINALLSGAKEYEEEIIKYMEYLDVIAKPVELENDTEDQLNELVKGHFVDRKMQKKPEETDFYIMPCMLPPRPELEELKTYFQDPNASDTPTLCLYIKKGLLPPFVFHRLIATALKEMRIAYSSRRRILFNGLGSFKLTETQRLTIWAVDNIIHLRVSFSSKSEEYIENLKICRALRHRFIKLVLKIFSFHGKDTYNEENQSDLFAELVRCPSCHEQVPFSEQAICKTGMVEDYTLGLLNVENLLKAKKIKCDCCNTVIEAKHALEYWMEVDEEAMGRIEGDQLTDAQKEMLQNRPDNDSQLVEIANMIDGYGYQQLAQELCIGEKVIERLKMDQHKKTHLVYYILHKWKSKGEIWDTLYQAMCRANLKTSKDVFSVIEGKDSSETEDAITKKLEMFKVDEGSRQRLSEPAIATLASSIGEEYWYVGLRLGLTQKEMEKIRSKCCDETYAILMKWRSTHNPFKQLVRALFLSECDWTLIHPILENAESFESV